MLSPLLVLISTVENVSSITVKVVFASSDVKFKAGMHLPKILDEGKVQGVSENVLRK